MSARVRARKPSDDEQRLASLYRETFSTDAGTQVLEDLLEQFPPDLPRFADARGTFVSDPIAAAFTDGQRYVTARIKALVKGGGAYRHD